MPTIVDYPVVLERLTDDGLECHYYNGGAFGFPDSVQSLIRGWIGPDDSTIRPAALEFTGKVSEPFGENLAALAIRAWKEFLPGPVWVMPKAHWYFELHDGNKTWLPSSLQSIGLDPADLKTRNSAAAIEFALTETQPFELFLTSLLEQLSGSDFLLAFPHHATVCTVHHHKQLWWVTNSANLLHGLVQIC